MDCKKTWRLKARAYLAAAFGSKCTVCYYDKTIAALDYHHIDPQSKDAELSKAMRNGHSWAKIVEEARKCTIVCCRCHREIHAGVTKLPENYAKFNEEYADIIKLKQKEFDSCPICGDEKWKKQDFCSRSCASSNQPKKFDPSKKQLETLIHDFPLIKVGKMLGVSDNAIRKRCKKMGISIPFHRRKPRNNAGML